MKKRYVTVSKLSDAKFRVLIKCFCDNYTALQIAHLLNINRNTANMWINRIRKRLYLLVEKERLKNATFVQVDETFFNKSKSPFCKSFLPEQEIAVFGIIDHTGKVYARIIHKVCRKEIIPVIRQCCAKNATIYTDGATVYKGLAKDGFVHFSVNHLKGEFSRYESGRCITTNHIENFWSCLKNRLAKFRGVKFDCLHLHIAESVWRFNHRHDNLYLLLLSEFNKNHL